MTPDPVDKVQANQNPEDNPIQLFWAEDIPAAVKNDDSTKESLASIVVQNVVWAGVTFLVAAIVWVLMTIWLRHLPYAPFIAAVLPGGAWLWVMYINFWGGDQPLNQKAIYAMTNHEVMVYNSEVSREDIQHYANNQSSARLSNIVDGLNLAADIAFGISERPVATNLTRNPFKSPSAFLALADIDTITTGSTPFSLVLQGRAPSARQMVLYCQSRNHQDEVLAFLARHCPDARITL